MVPRLRCIRGNLAALTGRRFIHLSFMPKVTAPSASNSGSYESDLILKTSISAIRNIGIIAHIDAGKTTTTERLLYYSGLTNRIGNVDEGDTITDYMTQEKDRGITIQSAAVTLPWKNHKINVIDTPGHADFTFEVTRSLRVLDGAVTILDAVAGVEAQTEKVWKQAKDLKIPIIAYINKMDRDGAGYGRTVKEIVGRLGTRAILVNVPYFVKDSSQNMIFKGIVDVINKKLIIWKDIDLDGKEVDVFDISHPTCDYPDVHEEMLKCREAVVETLGELDESIIDNFLETEDYTQVSIPLLKKSIRQLTLEGKITPILCGSSFKNIGVQPLMDAIVDYLPSPVETSPPDIISSTTGSKSSSNRKTKNKKMKENAISQSSSKSATMSVIDPKLGCVINNNKNLTTALAFKVINHPNRGLMVFVRVYSGKLQPNSTIINSRTGEKIKIGKLLVMNGDSPLEVKYLSAGNIGVITGTEEISTGDTIIAHSLTKNVTQISKVETGLKLLPIDIPPPVFSVSIEPTTVADKRKLDTSLEILLKEDPSLKLSFDEESGQSILSGMGELHLEITKDRLVTDMKVKADIGDVCVTYKETVTKSVGPVTIYEDGTASADEDSELQFGISLSILPFDGEIDDMLVNMHEFMGKNFDEETDVHYLDMNTAVVFDKDSMPDVIRKELSLEKWNLNFSYSKVINSMLSGATGALQMGGRLARMPIQNIVVYVDKWYLPEVKDVNSVSPMIKVTREAIKACLGQLKDEDFTILEPIMNVRTYVLEADIGNVSQDLMSVRNAKIMGIENENEVSTNNDAQDLHWCKKQMAETYVPFDATMQYLQNNNGVSKMVISSEAPLREMIGYLSKLRSLTKGRGLYDMELKGMERASLDRVRQILGN
ncbi:hypothetical protein PMKS-002540 [Pichia membranifaciens]|uniref:Ribosome-releasing factor 2, mitochondrial n=1 Tax=Pichia membranifaciens TaxID=4926 RepID=A0A1Q2YHU5_9ASCO|nr:hypothetical protein PMKS-002540 [Pichia membranifaciens]